MGPGTAFADLLEYPAGDLPLRVRACALLLPDPAAAGLLQEFATGAAGLDGARLEEEYAAAFDLDASCALYAGHHLFGETPRRSAFMARLAEEYRQAGFRCLEHEPPDYLPVMLRYLDRCDELREPSPAREETRRDLLADVILPASRKVLDTLRSRGNPYALVLGALVAHLEIPA